VALSPTPDEALRALERLADRLRVVGPRLGARTGPEAAQTLGQIRAGLQHLADLAADADGEPRRPVPEVAEHALGDQALVLGYDLLGGSGPEPAAERTDVFRVGAVEAFAQIHTLL
jgi:hypothetical protein